jgi:phosphoribosylanthranilate isomerase
VSERLYVGEFAAAVGIDTAANYNLLADRLATVEREAGSLAVGILMSEKTGLQGVENRHGALYPLFDQVEAIASAQSNRPHPLELIVHYNTDNSDQVGGQLVRALAPIAHNVNGVQVNGLDFDQAAKLEAVRAAYPHLAIIMQINSRLLAQYDPLALVEAVNATRAIDYVWLDDSGGLGNVLKPKKVLPYIKPLYTDTDVGIGMGGGLTPRNLQRLLQPILMRYPAISWDAQSGVQKVVRDQRHFDADRAADFLTISAELHRAYPVPEFHNTDL